MSKTKELEGMMFGGFEGLTLVIQAMLLHAWQQDVLDVHRFAEILDKLRSSMTTPDSLQEMFITRTLDLLDELKAGNALSI